MRFNLSVTSNNDYDSEDYFTAERTFNTEYLSDAVEHVAAFLKSAGFVFDRLEIQNDEDLFEAGELQSAEEYDRNYDPHVKF